MKLDHLKSPDVYVVLLHQRQTAAIMNDENGLAQLLAAVLDNLRIPTYRISRYTCTTVYN